MIEFWSEIRTHGCWREAKSVEPHHAHVGVTGGQKKLNKNFLNAKERHFPRLL